MGNFEVSRKYTRLSPHVALELLDAAQGELPVGQVVAAAGQLASGRMLESARAAALPVAQFSTAVASAVLDAADHGWLTRSAGIIFVTAAGRAETAEHALFASGAARDLVGTLTRASE